MPQQDGQPNDSRKMSFADPVPGSRGGRAAGGPREPEPSAPSGWSVGAVGAGVGGVVLGLVIGVAALSLLGGRGPAPDARLDYLLERSDAVLERLQALETRVAGGVPAEGSLAAIEQQAGAVEDRVLEMLSRSDLAMRQLAELDALRAVEIARLEAMRLPAWQVGSGDQAAEARILEMLGRAGAVDATLEALKDAPGIVAAATRPTSPAPTVDAWNADAAILAMVGGERGLLDALDTLDRLRGRVEGVLAAQDPEALELRALGTLERTLRAHLVYLDRVDEALAGPGEAAAAAIPLPAVPDLDQLPAAAPLAERVRALVADASALHAALAAAQ